jgi:hypothetical protein
VRVSESRECSACETAKRVERARETAGGFGDGRNRGKGERVS